MKPDSLSLELPIKGTKRGMHTAKVAVYATVRAVAEMFYGATIYEMVRGLHKQRSQREHLFALVVFGDILGIPILPPYYTLRLLPYFYPSFNGWKMTLLRERDLTDLCDQEIS